MNLGDSTFQLIYGPIQAVINACEHLNFILRVNDNYSKIHTEA